MEQNDWQQQRQRMPDTPPHTQNVRRHAHQQAPAQAPQQSPIHQTAQVNSSSYPYTTPTRSTASPNHRHSITSDFSGINIRDDNPALSEKSSRPNLSVMPTGIRSTQGNHQNSVPSSPTKQTSVYTPVSYAPAHPGLVRTTSDEMRVYQPPSNSRHSSPMHNISPTVTPYYTTTPHGLPSINEREPTMQWTTPASQPRQSPSRPYAFPPGRDSVSPRSNIHSQQSPTHNRHSMSHVPQSYDIKAQYSPRQATHFPITPVTSSPNISPASFSPRHSAFPAMNRDHGSMMSDIIYSSPPPAKFRIMGGNVAELMPMTNPQPKYRRANPDGGFIGVCLFQLMC
jgi:hypothetical protein